ncbi:MAG: MerR family transcriptional regulator [Syntrophobacteria bacterium]
MKTTSEVVAEVEIPRQKLYYLEQKAFVKPRTEQRGEKTFRYYSEAEVEKVRLIWKYLRQGFRYRAAYERAMAELQQPLLFESRTA